MYGVGGGDVTINIFIKPMRMATASRGKSRQKSPCSRAMAIMGSFIQGSFQEGV